MEITLKIRVKKNLAERLEPILRERGLTLDQTVGLYLRGMVNASDRCRSLRLADEMPFGKYEGETLDTIARADPQYLHFILNLGKTRLDPEVLALLETIDAKRGKSGAE